jgi:hypothetical protein
VRANREGDVVTKTGVSAALGDFLRRVERLDYGALLALSARARVDAAGELEVARARAEQVAIATGQEEARERLKGAIVNWASAGGARAAIWAPDIAASDVTLEEVRMSAAQAIFDAATARLLGSALDATTARILSERWDGVCG